MQKKEQVIKFSLFLRAASAEPVPPLGTILGIMEQVQ
jgi:hypothetical protein